MNPLLNRKALRLIFGMNGKKTKKKKEAKTLLKR